MALKTEILFFRGALVNLPALPEGMPAFALDSGQLFVGNGTSNVPIGGSNTTVSNTDGSLTISPTSGNVVASLNEDHGNSFTRGQTISAASGQTALTLNGESGGSAPTLVINDNASNPLMYVNAAGALVVVNVDTPTEHGIFDFRADPAFGGSAMYLESNTNGSRRIYIGSPGQTWYSLNLTHLAAGIEGLARLDLNVANGGDALFIGGQVIMHRADPAFQFGPQGYFSLLTFHAGSSTALMTLDSASGGSLTLAIIFLPVQAPTASAPSYVKGAIYFDTTLNKLRVGGASGWETITSV